MLSSSADRGWSGLSAQLCTTVRKGVIPWRTPQSDIRICVDTHGNESLVTRRAPGVESRIIARRGTVWLSPPGLQEGVVDIAEDMTGILHIYLPLSHFSLRNFDINASAIGALSYEGLLKIRFWPRSDVQLHPSYRIKPPPETCSWALSRPVWRRGWCKDMSAYRPLNHFRIVRAKGSISEDSGACWTISRQTWRAILAWSASQKLHA